MSMPTAVDLQNRIRAADVVATAALPPPGGGETPARHHRLAEFGRIDLSLARIAEGHADAHAILAEAHRPPRHGALYGVWASDGPRSRLEARRQSDGRWQLHGLKQYCSGAPFVNSALVTAHAEDGVLLFEVDVHQRGVRIQPGTWASPAMADTATGPVAFEAVSVPADSVVGAPNWYLQRPGFWHGALGPAACWAGGALYLVEAAGRLKRTDPHSRAHIGGLQAAAWGLCAVLDQAGREIDADPDDHTRAACARALMARHLIERSCTEVLDRFGRATGPQLLAFDEQVARQHMALAVYMRQCHAERDLETIAGQSPVG
jgi:alkylation response protein AidB-like acyl-CoA dehydrogenase